MRWYGPKDPVSLADIRQAGCSGVVTALHHIPVGDVWSIEEIEKRKRLVEEYGMTWTVIESLPVHDDIKKANGNHLAYIENYKASLRNVAACGLKVITYNFMPVLDWLRTDVEYTLPNGSKALRFERLSFVAFDLFLLKRPGAESDYTTEEIERATRHFSFMNEAERDRLYRNILLGLPGSDENFTADEVLKALDSYRGVTTEILKQNLIAFLRAVTPVAEEVDLKLAIHPDDPPYPVLGLPRVVSTEQDIEDLFKAVPSAANGLCFCTGSLGVRPDNDLVKMLRTFGDRIHFLHLRNTRRDPAGNFLEADHLDGDTDMFQVIKEIFVIMKRRQIALPMRPDHGHQMLDDLMKTTYPGYSAIGRLKGLGELRGLQLAVFRTLEQESNFFVSEGRERE
jgi:mannonate dehydratase